MRYKCLVLDHDDTVVNSTESINFPAFEKTLETLRPKVNLTCDEFFLYNFSPGFSNFCSDILAFSEEEMDFQEKNWLDAVKNNIPDIFPGIKEVLWDFHNKGGKIFVVSHSQEKNIKRDYQHHNLPSPERIFGWELGEDRRKPSPWPIEEIHRNYEIDKEDMVIVDDLLPGKIMADKAGIDFIGVGWAHNIEKINSFMKKEAHIFCPTVDDLRKILFK